MNDSVLSIRTVLADIADGSIETLAEPAAAILGLPGTGIAFNVIKNLASSTGQGIMAKIYDDISKRKITTIESLKHDKVFDRAEKTFWSLAYHNDFKESSDIQLADQSQIQHCWEVAEHVSLEGIRQSQLAKLDVLGRFYGKSFYEGRTDWDNLHQSITIFGQLTFRQLVVIYLLCKDFPEIDQNLSPTNPHVISEINGLVDMGLCKTVDFRWGGMDKSRQEKLSWYKATDFSQIVYEEFMLDELSQESINKTVETFSLN